MRLHVLIDEFMWTNGVKFRRTCWDNSRYVAVTKGEDYLTNIIEFDGTVYTETLYVPTNSDIIAKDWELVVPTNSDIIAKDWELTNKNQ